MEEKEEKKEEKEEVCKKQIIKEAAKEIKEKVREFFNNIKKDFKNYKVTFSTIVILTLFQAVVFMLDMLDLDYSIYMPFDEDLISRILMIFAMEAAFIEIYFGENVRGKIFAFLPAAVIAVIAPLCLDLKRDEQIMQVSGALIKNITSQLLGGYILLLLIGIIYYSFKRSKLRFEEYGLKLFANLMKVSLFYFVLIIASMMLGGIIDALFFRNHISTWAIALILVTGLYYAPQCICSLENMQNEPGELLKTFVKYIFSSITIIAMAIVYLYMLEIIVIWEIPSNEIFSIIAGLFCLGMPAWIIGQYYRDETKYSKVLYVLPYIFAPLILLQIYSIGIRIYEYGMTAERYMGLMLIVFEIAAIFIWHFGKRHYEIMFKFLAVLVVIAVFVPIVNMDSVSNIWQKNFLHKYYLEVLDGKELSELEYERLFGAYDYLRYKPQTQAYVEAYNIYDEVFVKLLGDHQKAGSKLTEYDSHRIHCCQMVGDIALDGYKSFSMLNQNDDYNDMLRSSVSGEIYNNKENVDFSNFKFIIRETGEEVTIDISDFAKTCIDYEKGHNNANKDEISLEMKKYNKIEIDADTTFYMNHFEIVYYEGIKEGQDYFKWSTINISGMLLKR